MAYCRFSCNDYQCDVYCYDDVAGGYALHIAKCRMVFSEPLPAAVPFIEANMVEWIARHQKITQMALEAVRVPIDLPMAGETMYFNAINELLEKLTELKKLGYRFPDSLIADIRSENEATPL